MAFAHGDKRIEILPSINVPTFDGVQDRIWKVGPYVEWCHIDVTDGVFSKHLTWHDPFDLPALSTKLKIEVHLMIMEPEKMIDQWLVRPVDRVVFHLEASNDPDFVLKKCREAGVQTGVAIRPETFWGILVPWVGKADMVQILGVNPGPSGQKIEEYIVDKIIHLRFHCPDCIIEIDGGVTRENIGQLKRAGGNLAVVGSAIFGSSDIGQAIQQLKNL